MHISVVIPCYHEPDILSTIRSIEMCDKTASSVEITVVVNSSETTPPEIIEYNKNTYYSLLEIKNSCLYPLNVLLIEDVRKKHAGVGNARKNGMETAIENSKESVNDTILVSLDADTLVQKNYLTEIEKVFLNRKLNFCTIGYEHNLKLSANEKELSSVVQYELYLRYYKHSIQSTGFPYSIYTIGSAFAVRASVYLKQGGMSKRQAGEDFYFLQKLAPLGNFIELNTTKVYPSPRCSDRVPFGTGPMIQEISHSTNNLLFTYTLDSINQLSKLFSITDLLYETDSDNIQSLIDNLPESILSFLNSIKFTSILEEVKSNSSNFKSFQKRFFNKFNAFSIIKYLNFAHETHFTKSPIQSEAAKFLSLPENTGLNILLDKYRKLDIQV